MEQLPFSPQQIEELLKDAKPELQLLVRFLMQQIQELREENAHLRALLAKDSHNSSKPPSSDSRPKPNPKPAGMKKKSKRRPGGQPGHQGRTLRMSDTPDQVITLAVEACSGCGSSLSDSPNISHRRHQVFDLPPLPRIQVTEYRAEVKCCPHCKARTVAPVPQWASQAVQYGPHIRSHILYLQDYQLLPFHRTALLLRDLFGLSVSQGTLANLARLGYQRLKGFETHLRESLKKSPLVNFDESGLRIKGRNAWLHVASNASMTHLHVHPKRGKEAMNPILPQFCGAAIHDGLKSYEHFDSPSHHLCNAHILRELTFLHEQLKEPWAKQMHACLLSMYRSRQRAIDKGKVQLDKHVLSRLETRYEMALRKGFAYHRRKQRAVVCRKTCKRGRPAQAPGKNLLDRLNDKAHMVMGFLYDFSIPFTNNQAERDLRMIKVKQKISGGFRSHNAAAAFSRLRSYIQTLQKQGQDISAGLVAAMKGQPFTPMPA